MESSVIELSKSALKTNIEFIKEQVKPNVRISSVIKGNAYGHGMKQIVPLLEDLGIDHFSVYSSSEARKAFDAKRYGSTLLVMGYVAAKDYEWMLYNEVECFVFNIERLNGMLEVAKKVRKKVLVHLEIETGMNRTGFDHATLKQAIKIIKENERHIVLKGVCTHFAGAESISNYLRIQNQRKNFKKTLKYLESEGLKAESVHTSCSAAVLNYPSENWDMVRIGILQFGLWPSKETYIAHLTKKRMREDPIRRVISWKSVVMDVKRVKKKEFIGYGNFFQAEQDMTIVSAPIGYSHGYGRILSNQGRVLIRGVRLNVIGIVNMNMLLIDASSLDEVKINDPIILIGDDNGHSITVSSFSDLSAQLNYELLTRLDKEIPRVVVE